MSVGSLVEVFGQHLGIGDDRLATGGRCIGSTQHITLATTPVDAHLQEVGERALFYWAEHVGGFDVGVVVLVTVTGTHAPLTPLAGGIPVAGGDTGDLPGSTCGRASLSGALTLTFALALSLTCALTLTFTLSLALAFPLTLAGLLPLAGVGRPGPAETGSSSFESPLGLAECLLAACSLETRALIGGSVSQRL
jgi:hypothetical protein